MRAPDGEAKRLLAGLNQVTVMVAMSPQMPEALVAAVLRQARNDDVQVTLVAADLSGRWAFLDERAVADAAAGRLRLVALAGGVPRRLAGVVDRFPMSLWDVDRLIVTGELPVDIFLARVRAGRRLAEVYHGDMVGYSVSALRVARRVGFEVMIPARRYSGSVGIPVERADVLTRAEHSGASASVRRIFTREQREIAQRVARLVPDGATLQIGVGVIPAATVDELTGKIDLGLHSGILPGSVQQLIASGAVTGARKTHGRGQHVATGLLGGDPNGWDQDVRLAPISQTHDPAALLAHENLWAINSAFEVDLAGQVNAEFAGDAKVASGAGQIDFARAAHACPSGGSVLALPARTRWGAPRIVARTRHPVTTPGSDVDYVVTEHGVARLHGLTTSERRRALIELAHPDDRPGLRSAAEAS